MSGDKDRAARGTRQGAALFAGAILLAGCSSASTVASNYETTPSPAWSARIASFFSGAKPGVSQPKSATPSAPEVECPGVEIRAGASTLNVAAKPGQATAGDLRYQLSFGQTARECHVQDGTMYIKVGVQGRAILGPHGAPGAVEVPLRYAVVREGPEPQVITTKFKRVGANIGPAETHVQFVDIEDSLSFPLPSTDELAAYVVYVGFDEVGDRNEKNEKKPARGKRSAQR